LTQSYSKLKAVQGRFTDCAESVNSLKQEKSEGKKIKYIKESKANY
jgi:prefoldin alpha subunit